MRRPKKKCKGHHGRRTWLRRIHRWLGLATALFVLLLSVTGIALNHSSDWELDRRYVTWNWAIEAFGVTAPNPSESFADGGHRLTRLGGHLYFDATEVPYEVESVTGFVVVANLAVVATPDAVILLTTQGEFVQQIDLSTEMSMPVKRIGRVDGFPVLASNGSFYIGDADVTAFTPLSPAEADRVVWPGASAPAPAELAALEALYRGRGLTVERLLIEIHSGRIVGATGPLLLDLVALGLIFLAVSGFVVWLRNGRGNGGKHRRRQ